jgi:hypothetical protein
MLGFATAKFIAIGGGIVALALSIALGIALLKLDRAQTKIERQEIWEEGVVTAISNVANIHDSKGGRALIAKESVIHQIGYFGDAINKLTGAVADQNSDIEMRGLILNTQRNDAREDGKRLDKLAGASQAQIVRLMVIAGAVKENPACRADPELLAALEGL